MTATDTTTPRKQKQPPKHSVNSKVIEHYLAEARKYHLTFDEFMVYVKDGTIRSIPDDQALYKFRFDPTPEEWNARYALAFELMPPPQGVM